MSKPKLIFALLLFAGGATWFFLKDPSYDSLEQIPRRAEAKMRDGRTLRLLLALTMKEQNQGLSGVQPNNLADDEGMLFVYPRASVKYFWMPDTYFDLDIFFLDNKLKVIDVERAVPHHPGWDEPIPRTRSIYAFHVLELKASSPLAKALKLGHSLKWASRPSFESVQAAVARFY